MVRNRIETKKQYPAKARKRQQEGYVKLFFIITYLGEIMDLRLIKSSRIKALDEAALEAVKNAAPFPVPPAHLFNGEVKVKININFRLEEN
jgi:protein TonB